MKGIRNAIQRETRNDVYETLCPQPVACQELRVHNTGGSS